jgi:HSP20 family protein
MATDGKKAEKGMAVVKSAKEPRGVGQYFEDVFGRPFLPASLANWGLEERIWAPSIDVVEKDDKFIVKAELPGVDEEDINVTIAGNTLKIEGEKESESEENEEGYHYSETSYGSFARTITIPDSVDVSKIEASCTKGVLEITLPKMAEVKPKKISVSKKKVETTAKKEEPPSKK